MGNMLEGAFTIYRKLHFRCNCSNYSLKIMWDRRGKEVRVRDCKERRQRREEKRGKTSRRVGES
jgi:hypothetical protein